MVVIDDSDAAATYGAQQLAAAQILPAVIIGVGHSPQGSAPHGNSPLASVCDIVVADPDDVLTVATANPLAAIALATLMRGADGRTVAEGLVAESLTYSMLQSGPEFAAWRRSRPIRQRPASGQPAVLANRDGDLLEVVLNRPDVRNALNATLRDEWYEALAIAAVDTSLRIEIRGNGPVFCSGGDLDEFGSRPDPSTAHVVRLARSLGQLIDRLGERITVIMHGPCAGSGVELAAFAGHVVADSATTFSLPEVQLGLIPGAGGTVSVTRRVGRHRMVELALRARPIEATTALSWGLIDEIR